MSWLESFLRGAGQGATLGWGDELVAKLTPEVDDGTNIPREYAAGSAEQDLLQKLRLDNATAAKEHPALYAGGAVAGALPSALAIPGGASLFAAGRAAATGLTGGLLGGLGGAGMAQDGEKWRGAGEGALAGAVTGLAGAAAAESLPVIQQAAQGFRAAAPAFAGAGAPQINRAQAIPPPRRTSGTWEMPAIPKAGKKPISESMIPEMEKLAQAGDDFTSAGNRKLIDRSLAQEKARTEPINRDVEYIKNFADQKEAGVAARAAQDKLAAKEFAPEVESAVMPKTVRPPRKKARGPEKGPAVQQELDLPSPEYSYHATPQENAVGVAELGLRPEQGGKNFAFAKNKDKLYMSPEEHAAMWAQKLEDTTGSPALQLRTPLKSEQVPGANAAVRTRTEAVPPERLQYKSPSGQWRAVNKLLKEMPEENAAALNQLDFFK